MGFVVSKDINGIIIFQPARSNKLSHYKLYIQNHQNFGLLASGTGGASESSFFFGGGGGGFFPAAPALEGAKDEAAEATVPACCVAMFIALGEAATREKPDCRALAC